MLSLSRDLIFIRREPDGSERRVTYRVGTPVAIPPITAGDEEGAICVSRAKELQTRDGRPYRVVQLDGRWRVIRAADLELAADRQSA